MMNRKKLRKLTKSPALFVRDALTNQLSSITRLLARRRNGGPLRRYTVISAVHNVESYLDDFFRSLTSQTIDVETQLEIIMVDDGSPDHSADVIAAWQAKHPRSIRYVHKENGGQASARNVGLEHATGDWVTFIDPDDFVDPKYFERIEDVLDRSDASDVGLVSCNFVYFEESTKTVRDTHPLRYRFTAGDRVVRHSDLANDIQLSAATALFRRDILERVRLRFDESIRPSFEDAHFTNRYLLAIHEHDVAFVARATYYYRKRADESSTLDRSWLSPALFDDVLVRGCRDLFERAEAQSKTGTIPVWLQRVVLYHLIWYFKKIINNRESIAFLSDDERSRFARLVRDLVAKIDESTILDFNLGGAWLYHKVGLLGMYKGSKPDLQYVYVQEYDPAKELVQLRYFYYGPSELEIFTIGAEEVFPAFAKVRRHDFLDDVFAHERIVWLPVGDLSGRLEVSIGGDSARLSLRSKTYAGGMPLRDVTRLCPTPRTSKMPLDVLLEYRLGTSTLVQRVYRNAFVFMDRDTQADDNAEHLYRHVLRNRPEINAFFVLRRTSHDWERLEREGFRLLAFGSLQHRLALMNARHLISSHADHYVVGYPSDRGWEELRPRRFTFLQHGVTKDDISAWVNTKQIACFITASAAEHASIVQSDGPYKFTEREVVLTGFPRHDVLGAGDPVPERLLVIMPTWRQSLVGGAKGVGAERTLNAAFFDSQYAQTWRAFLHSPALRVLVETHGYRVQFFPHANIHPYLSWFAPPAYIETVSHRAEKSMQQTFREASIMLTDYSSTAFEMAFLRKAVLYYQFDRELVFGGGHTTKKGYFDYDRDGFGPVCVNEGSLVRALSEMLAADARPAPEHLERMDRAFAYRDGRSCERTLDAILALDASAHPNDRSLELREEAARSATQLGAWAHAERRWARLLETPPEARPADAELRVIEAKRQLGKVDEADERLAAIEVRGEGGEGFDVERAELATAAHDWPLAVALWTRRARASDAGDRIHALLRLAEAYRRSGAIDEAGHVLAELNLEGVEPLGLRVERAELATADERWEEARERWEALTGSGPEEASVRLAEALAQLRLLEQALAAIDAYLALGKNPRSVAPKHEREARALRRRIAVDLRARSVTRESSSAPVAGGHDASVAPELVDLRRIARRQSR